jgi:hypothetical protein
MEFLHIRSGGNLAEFDAALGVQAGVQGRQQPHAGQIPGRQQVGPAIRGGELKEGKAAQQKAKKQTAPEGQRQFLSNPYAVQNVHESLPDLKVAAARKVAEGESAHPAPLKRVPKASPAFIGRVRERLEQIARLRRNPAEASSRIKAEAKKFHAVLAAIR